MPREFAGTGPDHLESPQATTRSSHGSEGSPGGRISPGGGVASVLAETIIARRAQHQRQQESQHDEQEDLRAEPVGMRDFAGTASGAPRQRRRRPDPLSVDSGQRDDPFGTALSPAMWRVPTTARSARDLRPRRLGLLAFAGDADNWEGDSPGTRVRRAVSLRGGESPVELGRLHKLAQRRAAQLQRDWSLALAVWDGHHDLVAHVTRAKSVEEVGSTQEGTDTEGACGTLCASVPALSLLLVLCGCGSQLPYELMNSIDRGCGALIAVCEALFGLAVTAPNALRQESWTVPVQTHACLAGAAVMYPLLLNQALASPLPVVLLSTLKNGNLVANALVGVLLLGKRYSTRQFASIAVVSAGLVLTALSGATSNDGAAESANVSFTVEGVVAVACLAGALLARALTGGLQEAALAKCNGTHVSADEMLFFQNMLGESAHEHQVHASEVARLI